MNQHYATNRRKPTHISFSGLNHYRQAFALVALAFATLLPVQAKQVTARQALDIARKYVSPNRQSIAFAQTRSGKQQPIEPFYVFNDKHSKGFVVVSGDDAMGEILAYGDNGTLDTLNANPGVKFLLQAYRERFAQLQQTPAATQPATRAMPTYKAVAPLLTCKWNQNEPYNKKTGYNYTGCVATAVAQVMYYHKWPIQGKGENTYTVKHYNTVKHADFSKSYYDWANMKDEYTYYDPGTQREKDAVAKLMSDVGIATNMQYTPYLSGAQNESAEKALRENFDYTTAFVSRGDEGLPAFTDIVRQELINGFPVYLSGSQKGGRGGHAWVTDGFNEQGLFHMNFGWGGQGDAYFSLSTLSVAQSGNEFGGKEMTFSYGLIAILAHPNKPNTRPIDPALLASTPKLKFNIGGSLRLPQGSGKTFAVGNMPAVEMNEFNNYGKPFKGDIGVGIFDMNGKQITVCPSDDHATGGYTKRIYGQYSNGEMGRDYTNPQTVKIKVNLTKLANGYYQLLPMCAPLEKNGRWGEWIHMRQAPRMVIEIVNGKVRIVEEDSINAGFQLTEQPSKLWLKPGNEETIHIPIRNKGGLGFGYFAKLQLLDAKGKVAFETQSTKPTELEGFLTTWLPFTINVPSTLNEGKYRMKLVLIKETSAGIDNPDAERFDVEKLYDKEETIFTVASNVTHIAGTTTANYTLTNNDGHSLTVRGTGLQRVRLFDTNGRLLGSAVATDGTEVSISLANLVSGVYLVQVMVDGQVHTHRLLKR
jgi:putative thiol protease/hemagglutinin prtT